MAEKIYLHDYQMVLVSTAEYAGVMALTLGSIGRDVWSYPVLRMPI